MAISQNLSAFDFNSALKIGGDLLEDQEKKEQEKTAQEEKIKADAEKEKEKLLLDARAYGDEILSEYDLLAASNSIALSEDTMSYHEDLKFEYSGADPEKIRRSARALNRELKPYKKEKAAQENAKRIQADKERKAKAAQDQAARAQADEERKIQAVHDEAARVQAEADKEERVARNRAKNTAIIAETFPDKEIVEVYIGDILSAYKNNEIGADNKYKGNVLRVTGIVDSIKKDLFDNLYVTLGTGAKYQIPQVQAFFDDSFNGELASLSKGQALNVACRIDGLLMNVVAKKCIILK